MHLLGKKTSYQAAMGRLFSGLGLLSLVALIVASFADRRQGTQTIFLMLLLWGGLSVVLVIWGLFLSQRAADEEPSAALVRRYFAALQGHDYATAFGCLGPNMTATGGAPLTEAVFARFQAEVDATQGAISHVAIVNWGMTANRFFSFRMTQASYTVQVTRGAQTTTVHPYVVLDGDVWAIRQFSTKQIAFVH